MNRVLKIILRTAGEILLTIVTIAVALVGMLYVTLWKCCNGPSPAARDLLIATFMETGQMKFVASWFCTPEEIDAIMARNSTQGTELAGDTDAELIKVHRDASIEPLAGSTKEAPAAEETWDENGVRIEEIAGRGFYAKMMIVKDPKQVRVGTIPEWSPQGKPLAEITQLEGAIGAINGGFFLSVNGNSGGQPLGVVVKNGEILLNEPGNISGPVLIAFNEDNVLIIKRISGKDAQWVEAYVEEERIRDAVTFTEHGNFCPIIVNGESVELEGLGSGCNPRTVIGQREDGAVLLLVTDGRGTAGHLGATAADVIGIMQQYGAVNAANLDGGSSSAMYYGDDYEMTSTIFTLYKKASWRIPTAFVVMSPQSDSGTTGEER